MSERISVKDLQAAVDKAVARVKIKPGPIIFGFVAPADFPKAEAHDIAREVAKISGLAGTPTVSVLGNAADSAAFAESSKRLPPGHIIIGLVAKSE